MKAARAKPPAGSAARTKGPAGHPSRAERQAANESRERWAGWTEWALAAALTAVAILAQVAFFRHAGPLWRDEINSLELARLPSLSTIYQALGYDSFPMLHTTLLHAWVKGGLVPGDAGLRTLGLLVGVLLLGSLWLSCRLLGAPTPLLSLALVGLNPWIVRTVCSLRPYGLGMVFIVATLGCVWKAVESSRLKWFLAAAVLAVLSVQCMYQNAFLLLAICLAGALVSLRVSKRTSAGVLGVGLCAALSLSIYVPSITAARSWSILLRNPIPPGRMDILLQALGGGNEIVVWLWAALAILSVGVGIRALLRRRGPRAARPRSNLALYGALALVCACVVYLAALKATQLLTEPWYYMPLVAIAAPAIEGNAWLASPSAGRRLARIVLGGAAAVAVAVPGWSQIAERRTNMDAAATVIAHEANAADLVVVNPFYFGVSFQHYYKGAADWLTVPPLDDVHIHRYDLVRFTMTRPEPIDPLLERMARTLQAGHRIWLVGGSPAVIPGVKPVAPPPAPHPQSGWYLGPYLYGWGRQVTDFIQNHCLSAEIVSVPVQEPVSRYENVPVDVISGWR